ncbi:MAG TPA: toxin-antitoxin system, toxin component, HicA family protein [Sphingobacteriaceae bacterium]|nr:toxin-antitoxin system, toxin component, HicA family protein [Sphingobacteriaceae bacterium]
MKSSDLLKKLTRSGIKIERQGKGSHIILVRKDGDKFSYPNHGSNEMGKGLENKILKWAGLK